MTVDDINTKIFCLVGEMNKELFNKVFKELLKCSFLDEDDIYYNDDLYNITVQDFKDVFNYLDKISEQFPEKRIQTNGDWPAMVICFEYDDVKFVWEMVHGQGTSCILYVFGYNQNINWNEDYMKIKEIDQNIRFYKKE